MSDEPRLYPVKKTGTSQDLMAIIARAHERELERTRETIPAKSDLSRLIIEAPFVVIGIALSWLVSVLPRELVMRFHEKVFLGLASPHAYAFDPGTPALVRGRALAAETAAAAGREPALFALISHPPVMGDLAHLNFELMRHAMLALRALRGRPCRPRLVVAIDPFALDTVPLTTEGVYAGLMGHYHLGLDRMAYGRNPVSRLLLGEMSWHRMPRRLIRLLSRGGEVGMVLAGGVPATTRALYGLREWLARARRESPLRGSPDKVRARLRQDPAFARFETGGPHGPGFAKSAWRLMEAWAMASLTGAFGTAVAERPSGASVGRLDAASREALKRVLAVLDLPAGRQESVLTAFEAELIRETPYRFRFFRVLAGRVLRHGRAAVLFPVVHRLGEPHRIEVHDAWAVSDWSDGRLTVRRAGGEPRSMLLEDFVLEFVGENFA